MLGLPELDRAAGRRGGIAPSFRSITPPPICLWCGPRLHRAIIAGQAFGAKSPVAMVRRRFYTEVSAQPEPACRSIPTMRAGHLVIDGESKSRRSYEGPRD